MLKIPYSPCYHSDVRKNWVVPVSGPATPLAALSIMKPVFLTSSRGTGVDSLACPVFLSGSLQRV